MGKCKHNKNRGFILNKIFQNTIEKPKPIIKMSKTKNENSNIRVKKMGKKPLKNMSSW